MDLTIFLGAFYLYHQNRSVDSETKCLVGVIACIEKQIHVSGLEIKYHFSFLKHDLIMKNK